MTQEALKLALEALESNKQNHNYCEDTWYSCPKHEDGCANEAEGDECNCGADKANAEIDYAITAIKEALREHSMREVQRLGQEIEAIKEALAQPTSSDYALGYSIGFGEGHSAGKALAQPEQEPVACVQDLGEVKRKHLVYEKGMDWKDPLYITPPQRTWVGLTKEQLATTDWSADFRAGALWAEAKLKELNHG